MPTPPRRQDGTITTSDGSAIAFTLRARPPFLIPDPHGLSMLLVSPGLLIALKAGFRRPLARLLWIATGLVAIPTLHSTPSASARARV